MPELSVSVVVPAYNEEALLPACLESLLDQDFQGQVEIIVVDNASTDRTAEIAHRLGVGVIWEPRRDYCLALIRGFAAAHGEIIACTDADTIVPRDWVSRLVREYQDHPEVVGVGGDVEFERPNWKGWLLARWFVPAFNWLDRHNPNGPHLWGANMSVRRDAFVAVQGWNPAYSLLTDRELSDRLRTMGRVVVLDSLKVRTSSRRWNQNLLVSLFFYASNFLWMILFTRPLWRDFPVVRAREPVRRRAIKTALVAGGTVLVLALVGESFAPRSSAFGKTYWHVATREKVVALTFDDGPNEPYTSEVLKILKDERVHATFFLIGQNVRRFPATAAEIAREGNVVGNHTDSHPMRFALEPVPRLRAEVSAAEQTIHAATGRYPSLFRPPQGLRSPWLMQVIRNDSLIAVTWDDAPADWNPAPSSVLVKRTLRGAHPGSIILLHDGMNTDHGANQSETVAALPRIIEQLRARGYRFLTLPELLNCPGTLRSWPAEHSHAVPSRLRRT